MYITENGIATADDARRIDYTTGALEAVRECIAEGIDVRGYLHWSALDNYEWGSFRPTFGLIGWDPRDVRAAPEAQPRVARRGGARERTACRSLSVRSETNARTGVCPRSERFVSLVPRSLDDRIGRR